jgi:hypothetical protein
MRLLLSKLPAFGAVLVLAACQSGSISPATPAAAVSGLHANAAGHPTLDVIKHGGELLATLTTNNTDSIVDYHWVGVGCGLKQQQPCYVFEAGEGTKSVPASASAPGCKATKGSVTCPVKGFASVGLVADANNGGGGSVTLQGGTGPNHPAQCTSVPVSVLLKGESNANTWDGCKSQTITCTAPLEEVIANAHDEIKGKCAYVSRKPGIRR